MHGHGQAKSALLPPHLSKYPALAFPMQRNYTCHHYHTLLTQVSHLSPTVFLLQATAKRKSARATDKKAAS